MPANLQSFSALHQRVKKYQSDYSLESLGDAFDWIMLETALKLNSIEIDEAIVDGGDDGGIDAIHVIERDVHIFTCTYASNFKNASSNFPQSKLDYLSVTSRSILEGSLEEQEVNSAVWDKAQDIWSLFDSGTLNFHFHICSNKEKPKENARERFEKDLEPFLFVDFKYWDLEEIVNSILQQKYTPVDGEVTFIEKNYFSKIDGSLTATVATIDVADLIELVEDPNDPESINEEIFNENVRVDLGRRNSINRSIFESAVSDQNFEFWYLNNGITMVCDECKYFPNRRSPKAQLKNVQIVNGGQTTRTLFHAAKEDSEKVENIEILVRIIQTTDHAISEKISETANRQTPVRTRDLRANDLIQRKLEDEFNTLGYSYERKKNQFEDQRIEKRLDAEEVGQVVLAYYLDMPTEARNQKSVIFQSMYEYVFDEDLTDAARLMLPIKLYKPIEELKKAVQRKKRKRESLSPRESFIPYATFHILNAIKLVSEAESLDLENPTDEAKARDKAIQLMEEVTNQEYSMNEELYSHIGFFKSKAANSIIKNYIVAAYSK